MLKIYNKSGKIHQEIPIDELIKKYSDLIPLINQPKPHKNLTYGENKIKHECKTILVDSDNQILEDDEEIDFEDDIYVCFEIDYKLELKSSFDSNIPFPSFVTGINLGYNKQELPSEWPKSVRTINLGYNTQKLPTEWPKSVHTIDLRYNKQKLPTEWPKSVRTICLGTNNQKLPTEWPKSVHTIDLEDNTQKLPTEWPKSVQNIIINKYSHKINDLLNDERLILIDEEYEEYNEILYFKLKE